MMTIGTTTYLTVKEVAATLGISIPTVRVWTNKGVLKAKRHAVNKYRLYKEAEVKKLLRKIQN